MTELPPLVDEAKLARYLAEQLPGLHADVPLTVERIAGGHSNETFIIRRGPDENWVLRRPPRGPLLPTAHDVGREYALISALLQTNVPVPRPLLHCTDESVLGAPFYLMDFVNGLVTRATVAPAFDNPAGRAALAEELIQVLVKLHTVDWRAVGLDKMGRPEGYLERQLKRWNGQLDKSRQREIPELDAVGVWLREHLPASPAATVVHGDYRIDNVLFAPQPPARILAVLDWELATIGDPLADLGYLLSHWREVGDPPTAVVSELADVTTLAGFPTRAQVAARYAELSGRQVGSLAWYEALAIWKLAILLEGNYNRYKAGTTDDHFYASLETGVPELARRALRVCHSAD